jgi:hypothetical protein
METDYSERDFTHFEEYDLEFLRELAEDARGNLVDKLELSGNFSEAEKIKNFSTEEWIEWSKKEKERIEVLEEEARKKFAAEFRRAD